MNHLHRYDTRRDGATRPELWPAFREPTPIRSMAVGKLRAGTIGTGSALLDAFFAVVNPPTRPLTIADLALVA